MQTVCMSNVSNDYLDDWFVNYLIFSRMITRLKFSAKCNYLNTHYCFHWNMHNAITIYSFIITEYVFSLDFAVFLVQFVEQNHNKCVNRWNCEWVREKNELYSRNQFYHIQSMTQKKKRSIYNLFNRTH